MKPKKPFSETKVCQFLKEKLPDVVDKIGDVFPPANILKAIVGERLSPEDQVKFDELTLEYNKLYFADLANARNREIETKKAGVKFDLLMNVTGFVILALTVLTVVAIYFFELKNKELAHFIAGEIMGVGLGTLGTYYFGSSKSSRDKDQLIKQG